MLRAKKYTLVPAYVRPAWFSSSYHDNPSLMQFYMMLIASTEKDLMAVLRHDLNVPAKQGYNLVIKLHSRDYQNKLMKVTVDAFIGYVLKDDLKKHFKYESCLCTHLVSTDFLFTVFCAHAHSAYFPLSLVHVFALGFLVLCVMVLALLCLGCSQPCMHAICW